MSNPAPRVVNHGNYWYVEVWSVFCECWLVQGEFLTEEDALADLRNWTE